MLLLLPLLLCSVVDSARILGVFPMPSISHQVVFRALTLELAKRGHELVVITPSPASPKDLPNYKEIDTSNTSEMLRNVMRNKTINVFHRGVIGDLNAMTSEPMMRQMKLLSQGLLNNEGVSALLNDKSQKFDLVIAEAMLVSHYVFSKIYDTPLIVFSSAYGLTPEFESTGTIVRHPILYPNIMRNNFKNLSFLDKLDALYNEYLVSAWDNKLQRVESDVLKSKFGDEAPTIDELRARVSLVLLNCFPIFDNNRPVPPNVVYLGGLHLKPVKELPKDLKEYLDNSKRGVVYVSFGSNIMPSLMDKELLDEFLSAFKLIPYDILWKFDGDNLKNVPANVKIHKWFPQRDLLVHPNIKLFVTQGGLQSTDEAIDAEVPLVGIPFIGDQWYNVNKYEELGIGVQLDSYTLTADDVVKGVMTVASNESFKQNIKKVKSIMYDTPQSPLERAVWWTEHVLRHKGAQHLKSPAANMSYAEYYMLDFVLTFVGALIVVLFALGFTIKRIMHLFKPNEGSKLKTN